MVTICYECDCNLKNEKCTENALFSWLLFATILALYWWSMRFTNLPTSFFWGAPIDTVEPFLSAHLNKQCYGLRSNSIECLMFYVECIENTSIRRRVEINVATMRILPYKKVDKSYIYVASLPIQQLMLHLCKSTFFAPTRFICSLCEVYVWSFKTVAAMMPEYVVSNANIIF